MRKLVKNNATEAFRILLKKLNVKFTSSTLTLFKEHPEFPSLFSFNHALSSLGLENIAVRTTYEQMQHELPKPLLVHLLANGGMYLVVESVENENVHFINESGASETFPKDEFLQSWSEVALILEKKENVEEAGFRVNRIKDLIKEYRYAFGITSLVMVMIYSACYLQVPSIVSFLFIATKTLGLLVSSILIVQFFDKNNPFVKRVCGSNGAKANCSSILNSPAANLFGLFSWSEIGLLYFSTFFLFILFAKEPDYVLIISYASVAAVPYTVYSVYYQWRVARSWCRLCLLVQGILLSEFLIGMMYLVKTSSFTITGEGIFLFAITFFALTSAYSLLKPIIIEWQSHKSQFANLNRIKFNREVFVQLLSKSRFVELSGVSPIVFGNINGANRITVITNPTCTPCKDINIELFALLASKESLSIEEIFLTENDLNDPSYQLAEFMLRLHESMDDPKARNQAFCDFYSAKRVSAIKWSQTYVNPKMNSLNMSERLIDHHKWCIERGFYSTPVVLLNQRFLPEGYAVKDLKYLID